jgi:outer membrane lipoprotein-sorting protein
MFSKKSISKAPFDCWSWRSVLYSALFLSASPIYSKITQNPQTKPNRTYIHSPVKKPVLLTPEQHLLALSQSWDSIQTLRTDLMQKNPNGIFMKADLYLRRPGEMRLVYHPPSQVQMIALKGQLIHYDGRRNRSQSMDLSRSPVAFLLQGKLHDHVQLVEIINHGALITLVMKIKKDPKAGKFGLTFNPALLKNPRLCPLTGWFMTDAYGKTTTITLSNTIKNGPMPKGTFELQKK